VNHADFIVQITAEADQPGDSAEPKALIAALANEDTPINALSDMERGHQFFELFYSEFPFVRDSRFTNRSLRPEERAQWQGLIRWIIQELRAWRLSDDPRCGKLVAIFIAIDASDWTNTIWAKLPDDIGKNNELAEILKKLIASFAVTFTSRGGVEPIWEREAVDAFVQADTQGDWAVIGEKWKLFGRTAFPGVFQTHAVRCLFRYRLNNLVEGLAGLRQTAVSMQVADVLKTEQLLTLAVASENPYVQFGCAYQAISGSPRPPALNAGEEQLMTQLLLKVVKDETRWAAWMKAFNAYPVRYPALQAALGHTLASASATAIDAYVNSLAIYPKPAKPDENRRLVATCLQAFSTVAESEKRKVLWTRAHERWTAWQFNCGKGDQHLFEINWSDLDYALVGYACECMDEAERDQVMKSILHEIQAIDNRWYPSLTDIITAWNCLLSRFQPYAYASQVVGKKEEWLSETKTYWPFVPSANVYFMMKYGIRSEIPATQSAPPTQ
jgi:hypothetical protein